MTLSYKKACTVLEEFADSPLHTETLIPAITLVAEVFHEQEQAAAALAELNQQPPQITDAVRECVRKLKQHVHGSPGMERRLALSAQRAESRKFIVGFGLVSLVLALYILRVLYQQGISHEQLKMMLFWSWIPALPWIFILLGIRKSENNLNRFFRFQSFQESRGITFGEWIKTEGRTSNASSRDELIALMTTLYLVIVVGVLHADY